MHRNPAADTGVRTLERAEAITRVRLTLPESYDFGWALCFLSPRAIPGLEKTAADSYLRVVRIAGEAHTLLVRARRASPRAFHAGPASPAALELDAELRPPASPSALRRLLAWMFDLEFDLDGFRRRSAPTAVLGRLAAARPWVRVLRFSDPFEALARGVLGQQVSLAAAATVAGRIVAALGPPMTSRAGATGLRAFPGPAELLGAGEALRRIGGLTRARAGTLLSAADAVATGALDLERLRHASAEEADSALRALPGIGAWTAAYIRMRGLGDSDAFPASDLGVLRALARELRQPRVNARDAAILSEAWRPWRAYATVHLWESLAVS